MSKTHTLHGIEPDNLLAFMALLGFHRALDAARPVWRTRIHWEGMPTRPHVTLAQDASQEELLQSAAEGCASLASAYAFEGLKRIGDLDGLRARNLLSGACRESSRLTADLWSAVISEVALRKDGELQRTPLYAVSGQQGFFDRLENVARGIPSKGSAVSAEYMNHPARLEEALFLDWNRKDYTDGFRWDPFEDRRYALRFNDPSPEGAGATVHGANRLASLALPLFTVVPERVRGEIKLNAVAAKSALGKMIGIRWPIWSRPASLNAVRHMLAGCGVEERLPGLGILAVYESRRIMVEKYSNFTRAVAEDSAWVVPEERRSNSL